MKIFIFAFSSPCWHVPTGTGHGKEMSLEVPPTFCHSPVITEQRDPNFAETWRFDTSLEFMYGRLNSRLRK